MPTDLNELFERLIEKKEQGLKDAEQLKKRLIKKLDEKIDELYAKRDLIAAAFENRKELAKHRVGVWKKFWKAGFKNIPFFLSMPFIYMMVIPAVIMQVFLELYHQVCFRIYRIPRVNPKEFFVIDRHLLPQLNWFEKLNCVYCGYFNGLVGYLQEIAGRTERYWCPIKHAKRIKNPHSHYQHFVAYDDAKALRKEWKRLRKF